MACGGIVYTIGVIAYLCRHVRWNHLLWHVAVVGANAAYFAALFVLLG